MAVHLSPIFNGFQGFTNVGIPNVGGQLFTYLAGTSTPAATYTTNSGLIANSNPIVLDAAGRPPQQIWLTDGIAYRFVLQDSLGNQFGTFDNIVGVDDGGAAASASAALLAQLADTNSASNGDALIGVKPVYTGTVATTQHQVNQEVVSVFRFFSAAQIADVIAGTHLVAITAAVQSAITAVCGAGKTLHFPAGTYVLTPTAGVALTFPNTSFAITGEGETATAFSLDSTSATDRIFDFTNCNGPAKLVSNLSLGGKIGFGSATSIGAYCSATNGLIFEKVWFAGLSSGCRKLSTSSYVHLLNCTFEFNTTGIEWDAGVECSIINPLHYRNVTDAYFTGDLHGLKYTTGHHDECSSYGVRLVGASKGNFDLIARQDVSAFTPDIVRLEGASTDNIISVRTNFGRAAVSLASAATCVRNNVSVYVSGALTVGIEVGTGNTNNTFSGTINGPASGVVEAAGTNYYQDMNIINCTTRGVLLSSADNTEWGRIRMSGNAVDWGTSGTINNVWIDEMDSTMASLSARRIGSRRAGIYGRVFYSNLAAPVTQTFLRGDTVMNVSPASAAFYLSYCITAGGANNGTRANTTAYVVGDWRIWSTGTTVWECTTAGTTAGAAPSIVGKVVGDTVVDGTVTWTMRSLTTAQFSSPGNLP